MKHVLTAFASGQQSLFPRLNAPWKLGKIHGFVMEHRETRLVVCEEISIPLTEILFEFVRSSGPGGQNVNKVNSQAQLHWNIQANTSIPDEIKQRLQRQETNRINKEGYLRINSQRYRDQEKNREDCLNRLRELLVAASAVQEPRKKSGTPRWVRELRLRNKKEKSKVKRLRRPPSLD